MPGRKGMGRGMMPVLVGTGENWLIVDNAVDLYGDLPYSVA
jgi:hypothetical protein